MRLFITAILLLTLSGCGLFRKKDEKVSDYFDKVDTSRKEPKQFWSPCVTIDFVDENFPEKLGDVIRVYNPKVSVEGAAEIVGLLLKKDKLDNFQIKKNEVRTCFVKKEQGFSLKVVENKK